MTNPYFQKMGETRETNQPDWKKKMYRGDGKGLPGIRINAIMATITSITHGSVRPGRCTFDASLEQCMHAPGGDGFLVPVVPTTPAVFTGGPSSKKSGPKKWRGLFFFQARKSPLFLQVFHMFHGSCFSSGVVEFIFCNYHQTCSSKAGKPSPPQKNSNLEGCCQRFSSLVQGDHLSSNWIQKEIQYQPVI